MALTQTAFTTCCESCIQLCSLQAQLVLSRDSGGAALWLSWCWPQSCPEGLLARHHAAGLRGCVGLDHVVQLLQLPTFMELQSYSCCCLCVKHIRGKQVHAVMMTGYLTVSTQAVKELCGCHSCNMAMPSRHTSLLLVACMQGCKENFSRCSMPCLPESACARQVQYRVWMSIGSKGNRYLDAASSNNCGLQAWSCLRPEEKQEHWPLAQPPAGYKLQQARRVHLAIKQSATNAPAASTAPHQYNGLARDHSSHRRVDALSQCLPQTQLG